MKKMLCGLVCSILFLMLYWYLLGVYNGHEFFIVDLKETFSNVINSCEQDIVKYFQECRDSIENMKQSTLDATSIDIDTSDVLSFLKSVGGYFVFVPKVLYYFTSTIVTIQIKIIQIFYSILVFAFKIIVAIGSPTYKDMPKVFNW